MKSTTLTAMLLILLLAGCGQSGPLYIPGDPSSIEPAEQPVSDEDKDEDPEDSDRQ